MTEEYNGHDYALEVGFSEEDAVRLKDADATNIRRIAKVKGLMPETKPKAEAKTKGKGKGKAIDVPAEAVSAVPVTSFINR